tara:strand:- start:4624 stop:5211 length:588 start_codon:yes stop_codon:yes gene_type:complete
MPQFVWTKKEFLAMNIPGGRDGKVLGRCCRGAGVIYISYLRHEGLRDLDDTLRHELIHWRFPHVDHGVRFQKLMKQLKNGTEWEPFTDEDYKEWVKKEKERHHENWKNGRANYDERIRTGHKRYIATAWLNHQLLWTEERISSTQENRIAKKIGSDEWQWQSGVSPSGAHWRSRIDIYPFQRFRKFWHHLVEGRK